MDSKFSVSKPKYFTLKKWILCSVMVANILFLVGAMFFVDRVVEYSMSISNAKFDPDKEEAVKEMTKAILVVVCIVGVLFELLFLYGTLKLNICLCTTYAVMACLGTLISVMHAFVTSPLFWVNSAVAAAVAVVSILYVRDLKFIHMYMHNQVSNGPTKKNARHV